MVKKNKKNAKRLNQNRDRFSLFLYTAKFTKAGLVEGRAEDTKEKTQKEGILMEGKRITQKSLKEYEIFLIQEEKSRATIEKYMRELQILSAFLGGAKVSKQKILEYRERLIQSYQPKTVNAKLSAVNSYLEFTGCQTCTVKLLKIQRQAFIDEERELSEQEYRRLLMAARNRPNLRLYHVILTICSTGIRVSELRFITVEALKCGRVQIHLKGKDRTILLPKKLKKKLRTYVNNQGIQSGPVFQTRTGKPLDRSNICHEMKSICEEAEVDKTKVFPHNLRHLFARCFYAVEKNLALLADILGHSSIETTRIYVAEGIRKQERIIKKMRLII